MKALLTTLMFAVVLVPFAAAAQKSAAKSAAKEMKATGTIVSATDTSLVVSSAKSKKETTYVLNADTQKMGTLTPGAKATIAYKMSGKERVATSVEASEAAAATPAATTSGAKKAAKSKTP